MERRINARGIIASEKGHIFAVKHHDGHTTRNETDYWAIPGGGLDAKESLENGLVRELQEELGVTARIGRLLFMQQFIFSHRDGTQSEQMEFFFHVTNTTDFENGIDLTATSHGHELARAAFINPATNYLLPQFLQEIDVKNHIDANKPVLIVDNLNEQSR